MNKIKLNIKKTAMTVGVFAGGIHLAWVILIATGVAQPLINFISWAHMISVPYQITGFGLTQAVTLIVLTSLMGFIFGWMFAWVWNKMHK